MTPPAIFFRLDDIGPSDRTSFRFIEHLESLERPYVLAVIPDALAWRMKRFLRRTRHAALYQHGVTHRSHARVEPLDEFPSECGTQHIETAIRRGKQSLEKALGREISGYVPPWNRLSEPALRVLEQENFRVLSADSILPTTLCQIPVSVDVYSAYRPVTVRSNAAINTEITDRLRTADLTGVMLHPRSVPRRQLPQLLELISGNLPRTVTGSRWNEITSGA